MLKYCISCLIPDSKPDISFNENGMCNACTNFFNRKAPNKGINVIMKKL